MKKIIETITLTFLLLSLAGCQKQEQVVETEQTPTPTTEVASSPSPVAETQSPELTSLDVNFESEDLAGELAGYMDAVKEIYAETYFCKMSNDRYEQYYLLYQTQDDAYNHRNPVKMVQSIEVNGNNTDGNRYGEYYLDSASLSYIPVENFNTRNELKEYLSQYLSEDMIDTELQYAMENDVYEYEGKLYLVRGGRGYGMYTIDPESVEVIEREGDKTIVKVNEIMDESMTSSENREPTGEAKVTFTTTDGKTRISHLQYSWVTD